MGFVKNKNGEYVEIGVCNCQACGHKAEKADHYAFKQIASNVDECGVCKTWEVFDPEKGNYRNATLEECVNASMERSKGKEGINLGVEIRSDVIMHCSELNSRINRQMFIYEKENKQK